MLYYPGTPWGTSILDTPEVEKRPTTIMEMLCYKRNGLTRGCSRRGGDHLGAVRRPRYLPTSFITVM